MKCDSTATRTPGDPPKAVVQGITPARVLSLDEAAALAAELRLAGRQMVFTNGCFDLLHSGHVDYLQRARALGDWLLVGLNGDDSVRLLKGPGRPIFPERDRVAVLASLRCVDAVVVFQEPTAEALVSVLRPHVYVKGGDWATGERRPPEAAIVEAYGGQVVFLPYLVGRSTTEVIARVRGLPAPVDDPGK